MKGEERTKELTFCKVIDKCSGQTDGPEADNDDGDPNLCTKLAQGQVGREFDQNVTA